MTKEIRFLKLYYLATPVFFAIEYFYGVDIRLEIPGDYQPASYIYYGVCFLAGFIFFNNQFTAAIFSLLECSFNILLLLLSVMWPIINFGNELDTGNIKGLQFGITELIHFLMVGGILLFSFYTNPLMLKPGKR